MQRHGWSHSPVQRQGMHFSPSTALLHGFAPVACPLPLRTEAKPSTGRDSITLCILARGRRDPASSRYLWENVGSQRVSHSSRKSYRVFRGWEAEGVLKCSLWRARFGSYCRKPLPPKIFNWQGLMQLKCILTSFKFFHARVPCFLLHLFLGSFVSVIKLTLEGSGINSPATKKRWLHPWVKSLRSCLALCFSKVFCSGLLISWESNVCRPTWSPICKWSPITRRPEKGTEQGPMSAPGELAAL